MGDMLYLAGHDYTDTGAKVDLINGVLRLRRGSWIPKIGEVGGKPVVETLDLVSEETNSAMIEELAKIEGLFDQARTYPLNPVQLGGSWLEWGIDAEPRASVEAGYPSKRAWVYGGQLEIAGAKGLPGPFLDQRAVGKLAIVRHPFWENLEPVTDSESAISPQFGDKWDLTGLKAEMGTAPGRIQQLTIERSGSQTTQEYWFGIRPEGEGFSEFEPVWQCEDGTTGIDASDTVDATASGGYNVTVSFSSQAGLANRMSISPIQAFPGTTYWEHYRGRYMVLIRAMVGSSTECGIVLRHGGFYTASQTQNEEVYIDNTSWKLIELGPITIPPGGARECFDEGGAGYPQYFTLRIDAERLSGTGSLYLDCLYLVPADHYVHGIYSTDISGCKLAVLTDPADRQVGRMIRYATNYVLNGEVSIVDWEIPLDVGCAYVVGQAIASHSLAEQYDLTLEWCPRWRLYRGV